MYITMWQCLMQTLEMYINQIYHWGTKCISHRDKLCWCISAIYPSICLFCSVLSQIHHVQNRAVTFYPKSSQTAWNFEASDHDTTRILCLQWRCHKLRNVILGEIPRSKTCRTTEKTVAGARFRKCPSQKINAKNTMKSWKTWKVCGLQWDLQPASHLTMFPLSAPRDVMAQFLSDSKNRPKKSSKILPSFLAFSQQKSSRKSSQKSSEKHSCHVAPGPRKKVSSRGRSRRARCNCCQVLGCVLGVDFPWTKPSSYWGTPMTMETPMYRLHMYLSWFI